MSGAAAAGGRRAWRSALGWSLLVLAFVGLLAVAFFTTFERVREEREVGYRGEAARNPLLAAERLLGRLDVPALREDDPRALPPEGHVLLALGAHHPPGSAYLDRLLGWVAAGGHLVVVPASGAFGDTAVEPLLAVIEVEVEWPEAVELDVELPEEGTADDGTGGEEESGAGPEDEARPGGEAADEGDPDLAAVLPPPPPIELSAAPGFPVRRVSMPPWPVLHHTGIEKPLHRSGRPEGAALVAVGWGKGRITVLADASFLENDLLGRHDHARFAWELVAAAGRPAGLAVVDWRRALPLSALLARRGWPAALAGALLLAAWIAWRGVRFGPPLPDDAPPRRSLLEHLRASGEYLWRRGERGILLAACRAAVARRLAARGEIGHAGLASAAGPDAWRRDAGDAGTSTRSADAADGPAPPQDGRAQFRRGLPKIAHADWARRPEGDRVRRLSRLSGVPAGTVAAALDGDAPDAADFVRTVATLERLRRSS